MKEGATETNNSILKKRLLKDLDKLRSPEGYVKAGFPNYDWAFGRDSLITSWELLSVEPEIAKGALIYLANHQATSDNPMQDAEPGKILHEFRPLHKQKDPTEPLIAGWEWPYFGSIDATPLFVMVAGKYAKKTGDWETVQALWSSIENAVGWMVNYGDKDGDGLLEYERRNPNGLFHQGWKDSFGDVVSVKTPVAVVEVQGYAYAAFQKYFEMAKHIDIKPEKKAVRNSRLLKKNFHNTFFWKDEKYYAFALDGDKVQKKQVTSNPGHLLGSGLLEKWQEELIVKRLMKPDMLTPFGIRTLSSDDPNFDSLSYHKGPIWPHDNWIIIQGLEEAGFTEEAAVVKKNILSAVTRLGFEPESFTLSLGEGEPLEIKKPVTEQGAPPNRIQAWSIGAILSLINEV